MKVPIAQTCSGHAKYVPFFGAFVPTNFAHDACPQPTKDNLAPTCGRLKQHMPHHHIPTPHSAEQRRTWKRYSCKLAPPPPPQQSISLTTPIRPSLCTQTNSSKAPEPRPTQMLYHRPCSSVFFPNSFASRRQIIKSSGELLLAEVSMGLNR